MTWSIHLTHHAARCVRRVAGRTVTSAVIVLATPDRVAAQPAVRPSPTVTAFARDMQQVDSLVQVAVREGLTPGFAFAVARDGHVVMERAYGVADSEQRHAVTPETRWYVASTSKAFTGFAMALLAERGRLSWQTTLREALPNARWHDAVQPESLTIAHLLSHTHQLTDRTIVMASAFSGAVPEAAWPSLLAEVEPATRPALVYSNLGYNVAGMILDRHTAGGWRHFLDSAVFAPAGMVHTTARRSIVPDSLLAKPHRLGVRGYATLTFDKRDETMHAAGGHFTTTGDLIRFVLAQMDGGVLHGRAVYPAGAVSLAQQLIAAHTEARGRRYAHFDRDGWGAGWDLGRYESEPMVSRFGGYSELRSHLSFLPRRRIGVVAFTNGGSGSALTDLVASYVYDLDAQRSDATVRATQRLRALLEAQSAARSAALTEDSLRLAQESAPPGIPVQRLAGRYGTPGWGTVVIAASDGALGYRWGVLAGRLRTLEPGMRYRFEAGGTPFTVVPEWSGPPGQTPALALRINGVRLPRLDGG